MPHHGLDDHGPVRIWASLGIQRAMAATKDFPGVTGRFSIDKNHDAVKEITVIALTNGRQSSAFKTK